MSSRGRATAASGRQVAKRISSYEVLSELGRGGMGVVSLARQPALERLVVLKTLRRVADPDPHDEERFRREAQAAAAVHHPNVVAVYDCFTWRGERYIAQEYVQGADLHSVLHRVGRLPPRIAALVALELARGLEEIHAGGTVHRDLKPANVLLGLGGQVKIADFGIALDSRGPALTRTGCAIGTPLYMSPEQMRGERVDDRSDLFAFGTLLYEMLTGAPPFAGDFDDANEGLLRRMEAGRYPRLRARAPRSPGRLVRLVNSTLRARPRRRPASARDVRNALESLLGTPAPSDCRDEIASWMYAHDAFPEAPAGTAPVSPPRPASGPGRVRLVVAAAAWLALAVLVARGPWLPGAPDETWERTLHVLGSQGLAFASRALAGES